ncbi:hypothetical protein H0194_04930 [Corynebacterium incognita]|uniref:Terminal beta-(1->2)-arabinofuranosyltransferase C-terminal domain-containing protein n=1 Tax=Corynebacterium incognita TaxID=2754725 RepID=A0A7G7CRV5_9CORY|nr:hypothetical protein [Corynebacterium incognita]QNE90321.1 hypothetical protein H0194_04930 [Corynebacterium incognita]
MHSADRTKRAALLGAVVIGVLTFWGAWTRRWMSDDGLIVLRTVRNLMAGNGPVFNAGERVETNTSTLWQYLIFCVAQLTGGADPAAVEAGTMGGKLEHIAMWLAIIFSVAATVIAALATARLYRSFSPIVTVPFGLLIYLALPPARDFFTSGLEWGLAIFYLAVLWALLIHWAIRPAAASAATAGVDDTAANTSEEATEAREGKQEPEAAEPGPAPIRTAPRAVDSAALWLAFWCGVSWLVRPEFALYGGVVGLVLLVAHRTPWGVAKILGVALPLPLAYQIFRMGYYGLLTPHTAVAKSASGAAWSEGFNYLGDLVSPYALWLPLIVALIVGGQRVFTPAATSMQEAAARSRTTAVSAMLLCGFLHLIYVIRVGGDFMHGRMLLLPLFALLLPVAVIPVRHAIDAVAITVIVVWAGVVAYRGNDRDWELFASGEPINIVDEREFWTYSSKREQGDAPLTAEDFRVNRNLNGFPEAMDKLAAGDAWAFRYTSSETGEMLWSTKPRAADRADATEYPGTVYFINLGMSSMNAPLNVRVLDPIGLATPIAARQPRLEDARIGHDKALPYVWQVADTATDIEELPGWLDKDEVEVAREALDTPDFQQLFASYREPLTAERFVENLGFALSTGRTLELDKNPRIYVSP